ncbi:glycoside hydrolase family 10 protein [Leptodesmis sp.]|uniref:glycoside hydrolase family 10 protein n=1 Tax=Leptodesmis sp. TaxID=3100501 RepID=UPI004053534E
MSPNLRSLLSMRLLVKRFILRSVRPVLPVLFLLAFAIPLLLNPLLPGSGSSSVAIAQQRPSQQEIRGVWMTSNDLDILRDRTKLQGAINQLKQLNFNTIYPVVWNAGYALYPSTVAQQSGIQSFVYKGYEGQDMLADLIAKAHAQGLLVIPWFEFGFMAPPSSELATQRAAWLTQRQDGSQTSISDAGEVVWLNPFRPEVQKFITDLVLEIVTQYDVDGIQFDDHTSLPNDFGYDPYTIALYTRETKKAPPPNPLDQAWMRWRANKITTFMVQLNQAVKARKPKAIFSLSPNYYDFAYKMHLQDWLGWLRKNIVDELVVQVYRPNLESFQQQIVRPEIQEAQQKIPTGIGILTGLRNKPVSISLIQAQTQAARDRGLGVSFFYYESLWDASPEPAPERQAGFQALFVSPAVRSAI